jgi:ABC-type nitrate/sulfonate/bicarbonate transport system permease component
VRLAGAGRVLVPAGFAVIVLGLWQLYTAVTGVREIVLPSPLETARALTRHFGVLMPAAGTTACEVLLGLLAATLVGIALALAIRSSTLVERAVYPWLVVSQTVPIPAIAPIVVIWTGFDLRPKVIVIALVCFFPIVVNTVDGLRAADPELMAMLRSLGASRWQRLRFARLPAALPSLFSGLKLAATFSVLGAVFAEWVGSSGGLGYLILQYNNQSDTASMFAAIVLLAAMGIALFALVSLGERLTVPWAYHRAPSGN